MENNIKVYTVEDQHRDISKMILNNMPVIKSFRRILKKSGSEILCKKDEEIYLKLFNNKNSFYFDIGAIDDNITPEQFSKGIDLMKKSITYFIQNWSEWIRLYNNKFIYDNRKTNLLSHNAIIYFVFKTDMGELIPFAYVCELQDTDDMSEVEDTLSNGCIDSIVDMFCHSHGDNWYIMSVIKIPVINKLTLLIE